MSVCDLEENSYEAAVLMCAIMGGLFAFPISSQQCTRAVKHSYLGRVGFGVVGLDQALFCGLPKDPVSCSSRKPILMFF
jgi:hypothetical protein